MSKKSMEVRLPLIPSFLIVGIVPISIKDFSISELEEIGKEWTQELIRKAREK